jgi:hypothetical protein
MTVSMHGEMIGENLGTNPAIFLHTCPYCMTLALSIEKYDRNKGDLGILLNKCLSLMTMVSSVEK